MVEEAIHVKFNDIEPDKDLLELDEFLAKLRLEEGISSKASVNTNTKVATSTQPLDSPQEEVREPTR